jgi:hypothetical protein
VDKYFTPIKKNVKRGAKKTKTTQIVHKIAALLISGVGQKTARVLKSFYLAAKNEQKNHRLFGF